MFVVVFREPRNGEVYDDRTVLLTEDLVKAVLHARTYRQAHWNDHHWSYEHVRAYVFEIPLETPIDIPATVYCRKVEARGRRRFWKEYWTDPKRGERCEKRMRKLARDARRKAGAR